MFGFFYYDWTILIVLPAMLFALWAEFKVKSTFQKYAKTRTHSGLTGAQAARRLLDANGLYNVNIAMVERELSNAINAVALDGENLRSALDEAIKRIDRELERKLEEFGRLKNGVLTQPFIVPDIETVKGWLK